MDGGVIASATWAGYVAAATTQRLHWRRPNGEWWWEWISLAHGDMSTCDGDYDGGAVEGAPVALAFDAGHGSDGGLWIGHAFGLQVLDLTHGALQRFGVYDGPTGLPVANVTSLAVGAAELWVGTARGLPRRTSSNGEWRYIAGRRWLPGAAVSAVVSPAAPSDGARRPTAASRCSRVSSGRFRRRRRTCKGPCRATTGTAT